MTYTSAPRTLGYTAAIIIASAMAHQPSAHADVISFQEGVSPTGAYAAPSTHIRGNDDDGNFASSTQLIVGSNKTSGPLRGLLAFDLSALGTLNPATIDSVELVMHYSSGGFSEIGSLTIDLRTTQAFDETTATWEDPDGNGNTADDVDGGSLGTIVSSLTFNPTAVGDHTFSDSLPFRDAVTTALAGDNMLYLLMHEEFDGASEPTDTVNFTRFDSEDAGNTDFRPELVVNYTIPEPASLGLLGLGALCMLGGRRRD